LRVGLPGLVRLLALGAAFWSGPVLAQVPDAALERLKDHGESLQLEKSLNAAARAKSKQGLRALATPRLRQDVSRLLGQSKPTDAQRQAQQDLALQLGPCHYAGVAIRGMIVGLADGRLKVRSGSTPLELTPSALEGLFVENMRRCEVLNRLPVSQRLIGTTCAVDGKDCRSTD
jgi:hypothetical protein